MAADGRITDAISIVGLFRLAHWLSAVEGPESLELRNQKPMKWHSPVRNVATWQRPEATRRLRRE